MNAQAASLGHSARVISLVGVAHLMSHVYQLALPPLFPLLARDFEVSYTALGLLVSVFSVAAVLGQVPMGFVVDRIGGGKVLIAGLLVQAAAIAAIAAVPSYWVLLLVIAVAGLAHSVYHPADYAILSRAVPEGRLGRAYTFPLVQRQYRDRRRTHGDGRPRRVLGLARRVSCRRPRRDRRRAGAGSARRLAARRRWRGKRTVSARGRRTRNGPAGGDGPSPCRRRSFFASCSSSS